MNKSLEVLKSIYKPYRYTIKGHTTHLETTSGDFIIKEKKNDIKKLFNYLSTRNFYNYPTLIDGNRKDVNVFEYIEDKNMPKEQKLLDITDLISDLHAKTFYYKEVSEDKFKSIYEDILSEINYLKNNYDIKYELYFNEIYMSPSHYLFMRNYYKINEVLNFCEKELNEWYKIVKKENKIRICVVHNNLSLDHFIKNDKDYLISWDNYKFDTPILDFVSLYKNEFEHSNFDQVLNRYLNNFPLFEYEKKLLFIILALPSIITEDSIEFNNTKNFQNNLDYIFKTEELLRPYYAKDEKEKQEQF